MSKTPWKKNEASTGSSDQQSLTAPADAGAAAVGAPLEEAVAKAVSKARLVKMYRDTPMHPGGPVTADVPESEIASWAMADWKVRKS